MLSHYATFALSEAYWRLDSGDRGATLTGIAGALPSLADAVHCYQVFPARNDADLLVWSTMRSAQPSTASDYFRTFGAALSRFRQYLRPTDSLWGFTRPSQYHPGQSTQEMDPFSADRKPYLVVYPFSKTKEWYMLGRDARQGMMNEHIRVGKEYPDISQLLLYSTGLQDQEFVVAYETDDLARFSELVVALRGTDGRPYTLRDTPIYTGVWRPLSQILEVLQ
jgi:chlorite dismutase